MREKPWYQRMADGLFARVDAASLAFFRFAFGITLVVECFRYYTKIDRYWLDPSHHFTYPGFGWVQPWPGDGMYIHFWVMGTAAFCVAIGFLYRLAAPLFFVCFTYIFLLAQTQYLNHFYLVSLIAFWLSIVPAHRTWSVDSLLWPDREDESIPAWSLWIVRFHIALPYFFGGIAKLNADWLRGEPLRIWLANDTDFPIVGQFFTEEWMIYFASYSSMLFDLLVVPLLLWRRTRWWAFGAALLFHLSNAKLFSIGIFPWLMIAATLIFFPPDWPRRVLAFFTKDRPGRSTPEADIQPEVVAEKAASWGWPRRVLVGLLGIYLAVHLLLPFRHFLYDGNCSWTEEGHMFAWHMMLRTKRGKVNFEIEADGFPRQRFGSLAQHLSKRQYRKMSTRPDRIHRFAKHVAEVARETGLRNVEVYALTEVSLNGRKPQPIVDPDIDLASTPRSVLGHSPIIIHLKEPFLPPGHPDRPD